jgi:RecB family exonuclease
VVIELDAAVGAGPSRELVELLERGIAHVVKVIQTRADDSSGMVGDLARDLLELHARACDSGVADPVKLARWMIRFRFVDQDFFEADPVRYRGALGEAGLVEFRSLLAAQTDQDGFAARYARERLAVLDGDSDAIVAMLGGDLSQPHQFIRVAEAMVELGRDEEAIAWARRGIEQTTGWQTDQLYNIACAAHGRREEPAEALALRRAQHERTPTSSSYRQLRTAAEAIHAWPVERDAARRVLSDRNPPALVDALLDDGEDELGWQTATALPDADLGDHAGCGWPRLGRRPTRRRRCPSTGG